MELEKKAFAFLLLTYYYYYYYFICNRFHLRMNTLLQVIALCSFSFASCQAEHLGMSSLSHDAQHLMQLNCSHEDCQVMVQLPA